MRFLLGVHRPHWLERVPADVPLFVSRATMLAKDKLSLRPTELPRAAGPWALDSGGFTELSRLGCWSIDADRYAADVGRIAREVGGLEWVAPQDWMCEPGILNGDPARGWPGTGLDVAEHQRRTVENFVALRELLGPLVVPVLQGWEPDDYQRCADLYGRAGVALDAEPLVGVGSVCRRQGTGDAARVFRTLADLGLSLHGFGVKTHGLTVFSDALASADSMAWSLDAKMDGLRRKNRADRLELPRDDPMRFEDCGKRSCANCLHRALSWRARLLDELGQIGQQTRMEEVLS